MSTQKPTLCKVKCTRAITILSAAQDRSPSSRPVPQTVYSKAPPQYHHLLFHQQRCICKLLSEQLLQLQSRLLRRCTAVGGNVKHAFLGLVAICHQRESRITAALGCMGESLGVRKQTRPFVILIRRPPPRKARKREKQSNW